MAYALSTLTTLEYEELAEKAKFERLERKLDFNMLKEYGDHHKGVDKLSFLVGTLTQLGVLDMERDVNPWLSRFDELDKDQDGLLTDADIDQLVEEEDYRVTCFEAHMRRNTHAASDPLAALEVDSEIVANALDPERPISQVLEIDTEHGPGRCGISCMHLNTRHRKYICPSIYESTSTSKETYMY